MFPLSCAVVARPRTKEKVISRPENRIAGFIFHIPDFTMCYASAEGKKIALHGFVFLIYLDVTISFYILTLQFDVTTHI